MTKQSAFDTQVGGNHYKEQKYQVVEFLSDNMIPAPLGYALKYVTRYPNKNQDDLEKALHCIDLFAEWFKKNTVVDDEGSITDFPYFGINLQQVYKYTHQFSSQKAIILQKICALADIPHFVSDIELNLEAFLAEIQEVKEAIIAYKEGTFE